MGMGSSPFIVAADAPNMPLARSIQGSAGNAARVSGNSTNWKAKHDEFGRHSLWLYRHYHMERLDADAHLHA